MRFASHGRDFSVSLVMAEASAVPWDWEHQTNINSTNVEPAVNEFDGLEVTFAEVR